MTEIDEGMAVAIREMQRPIEDGLEGLSNNMDLMADKLSEHDGLFDKLRIITDETERKPDKIYKALAKAQAELTDPKQEAEADAGKYKYRYATLSGVLSVVRPVLAKNGLCLTQLPGRRVDGDVELLTLTTILGHESGQSIENYFEMYPPQRDPQGIGSAMTYMRRYVAMSICGIAGAQDDDAEKTKPGKKAITAAQADQIFNLADELFGADSEAMLKRMCEKIHMVEAVRDIPADEFDVALKRIENQAKNRGTKAPEEVEGKSDKPAAKKPAAKPSA